MIAGFVDERTIEVRDEGGSRVTGDLVIPDSVQGLVIFVHGSGSSRHSVRNRYVARTLQQQGLATLLMDLLTPEEDRLRANRFDIRKLTVRVDAAIDAVTRDPSLADLPIGLFGASTGAAAALMAAADRPGDIRAVVCRGGRPDLAMEALHRVCAPTLLIVGGLDDIVIELNEEAFGHLTCDRDLQIVQGATHLFEEPGTLEAVAALAAAWFSRYLNGKPDPKSMPDDL